VLEPAERRLLIIKHAIDRYAAGEDPRGHAARALDVVPLTKAWRPKIVSFAILIASSSVS
jgi:hypothetical protein